jgi:outer membrane protein insertion porin family
MTMTTPKRIRHLTAIVFTFIAVLGILWIPSPLKAEESVGVIVLPFKINAHEELSYLRTQIATVIGAHLEQDGATVIPVSAEDSSLLLDNISNRTALNQLAGSNAASHIITGSFTLIGDRFSIDAQIFSTAGTKRPDVLYAQGRNLENLQRVIKDLSQKISLKLFQREMIAQINIAGNQRIEADAIQRLVKSQVGSVYQPANLSKDLKAIFAMGYFDDLWVEAVSSPEGKIITFHVKEKATIRRIRVTGNNHFDEEKIKENLTISTGSIVNIFKIRKNIEQIETLYKDDNYYKARVDYEIMPIENNQADLEFKIEEGPKLYITDIVFEGNRAFTAKRLKKEMSTSEKGFLYWITSSGDLDRATLDQDIAKLNAFYHNSGYIRARVGDPQVDVLDAGIQITIKIEEGPQFTVGKIDVDGDLIKPKEELLKLLTIGKESHYDREKLQQDVIALTDIYGDEGYAHADVAPQIKENVDNQTVDITYHIEKKQLVYFEDIVITGNTNTRDKVIRRELRVYEQALFNGKALKRSIRNLYRLDYFEDIKVNTLQGSADDKMDLTIDVKEKSTGVFSFGAGFSSEENVFLVGAISQRNFLGRGQTLQFNGTIGGSTSRYSISFTEPWLFDTRLSATIDAYNQQKDYSEYDLNSLGGGVRFSYPIFDYTRFYWGYNYDQSEVDNITDEAADTIKELEGVNITSSVKLGLGYDSRDRTFNATEGSKHSISYEYAGLGGDIGFNKYLLESGWYIPLFKGFVGFVHGKAGFVRENSDGKFLPDYEKFYLGGINSLRGYGYRGVYLTEINKDGDETKVGGESMVQFNIELIIPLYTEMGLVGVVFYDRGNVYADEIEWDDMRASYGYGIRWLSPLAPIRLEYGIVLDPREGDETGRWEFTLGGSF